MCMLCVCVCIIIRSVSTYMTSTQMHTLTQMATCLTASGSYIEFMLPLSVAKCMVYKTKIIAASVCVCVCVCVSLPGVDQ